MWRQGDLIGLLMYSSGLIITCILLMLVLIQRRNEWGKQQKGRFPPGPFAWPIIGHLHLFFNLPHQKLGDVSRKYGYDMLGLCLGQQRAVVVSSPELAKQVLLTHDKVFADRPPLQFSSILLFGCSNGIIFSSHGPQWRHHRRICMLHLFSAKRLHALEYVRHDEVRTLLHSIHQQSCAGTTPIDLSRCVGHMSSRLMMRLLRSKATMQVGGENLQDLVRLEEQEVVPSIGDLIPSLSFLDFFKNQRMRRLHARLDKVYSAMLTERKGSAVHHDDLIHALLSEEEALTMDEIKSILNDMIGAGIHTTALTLEWIMAELLRNPHCLHELQKEIDTKLGKKEQIRDADLPNLSYLKCVVKEASRLHPVLPLLVPHMSIEECRLQGYTIPAKTLMFVNIWAIRRDERVWPNPNEFMPERFQGKAMDLKGQHFELLPFGSGRRSCLGLPLALSIIEVTLANLVSCFDWELPYGESHTSVNMDEKRGIAANKATPVIAIPKPRVSFPKLPNM